MAAAAGRIERLTRVMFIGTCRMHDPVKALKGDSQVYARSTPHRFHTAGQTLQFVQHMTGAVPYLAERLHLVSDYAAAEIFVNGMTRQALLDKLAALRSLWASFDVFVIEISTRREHTAELHGQTFPVNTFSARDQQLHAAAIRQEAALGISVPDLGIVSHIAPTSTILHEMRQIKQSLGGRPIIWVSHMRPAAKDPSYEKAMQGRADMAAFLRLAADALGDGFVDPSETAAEMGQAVFFSKKGSDFDHLSPAAASQMAKVYQKAALARSRATPPE